MRVRETEREKDRERERERERERGCEGHLFTRAHTYERPPP